MAKTPQQRDLEIVSKSKVHTTPKGNSFLECRSTGSGIVAFWGSSKTMHNIEQVLGRRLPFMVRCGCIDPTKKSFPKHDIWVPETQKLEFVQAGK